jgi:hypothetical protein
MMASRRSGVRSVLQTLVLAACSACGGGGVDWSDPENLLYREKAGEDGGRVRLEYWSLLDVPCKPVYEALTEVEKYRDFIPGVDNVQLLSSTADSKTVQIAQRVIGRQNNAKVEWHFNADKRTIDFRTLASDLTYNDGHYEFDESPDKKRCLIRTTWWSKEGRGLSVAALQQGTREAFMAAARGVRKRVGAAAGG